MDTTVSVTFIMMLFIQFEDVIIWERLSDWPKRSYGKFYALYYFQRGLCFIIGISALRFDDVWYSCCGRKRLIPLRLQRTDELRPGGWHQDLAKRIQPLCLRLDCCVETIQGRPFCRHLRPRRCQKQCGELFSKKPPSDSPGWLTSLCTDAYSPAVTWPTSSWLRRSALTGNTLATSP